MAAVLMLAIAPIRMERQVRAGKEAPAVSAVEMGATAELRRAQGAVHPWATAMVLERTKTWTVGRRNGGIATITIRKSILRLPRFPTMGSIRIAMESSTNPMAMEEVIVPRFRRRKLRERTIVMRRLFRCPSEPAGRTTIAKTATGGMSRPNFVKRRRAAVGRERPTWAKIGTRKQAETAILALRSMRRRTASSCMSKRPRAMVGGKSSSFATMPHRGRHLRYPAAEPSIIFIRNTHTCKTSRYPRESRLPKDRSLPKSGLIPAELICTLKSVAPTRRHFRDRDIHPQPKGELIRPTSLPPTRR